MLTPSTRKTHHAITFNTQHSLCYHFQHATLAMLTPSTRNTYTGQPRDDVLKFEGEWGDDAPDPGGHRSDPNGSAPAQITNKQNQ